MIANYIMWVLVGLNGIMLIFSGIRYLISKKKCDNWEKIYPTFRQWSLNECNKRKHRIFSINNNFVVKAHIVFGTIILVSNSYDNCTMFDTNWKDPFTQIRKYFKKNWSSIKLKTKNSEDGYRWLKINFSDMQLSREELENVFYKMINKLKDEFNWNLWMQ